MHKTVIIILAAGESSRMKEPKQLLPFKEKTFVTHTIDEATKSRMQTILVLGANELSIKKQLQNVSAPIVYNQNWQEGISSSIKAGLNSALEKNNQIESCIFCVCDQPYISADIFLQLTDKKHTSGKKIIACSYAETIGTPVLFDKKYFNALMNLQSDEGAKKLLSLYKDDVDFIPFEKGEFDIDTEADYNKLIK